MAASAEMRIFVVPKLNNAALLSDGLRSMPTRKGHFFLPGSPPLHPPALPVAAKGFAYEHTRIGSYLFAAGAVSGFVRRPRRIDYHTGRRFRIFSFVPGQLHLMSFGNGTRRPFLYSAIAKTCQMKTNSMTLPRPVSASAPTAAQAWMQLPCRRLQEASGFRLSHALCLQLIAASSLLAAAIFTLFVPASWICLPLGAAGTALLRHPARELLRQA